MTSENIRQRALAVSVLFALVLTPAVGRAGDDASASSHGELVRALKAELLRSMSLELPRMSRPFFISYAVVDQETEGVMSEYGGLVQHDRWRTRHLEVDVRVGDRTLGSSSAQSSFGTPLPLDDNYDVLRRQIWLATDSAYKTAATDLEQKRAALTRNQSRKQEAPEFSTEKAITSVVDAASAPIALDDYEAVARKMSGVLTDYPAIQEGVVELVAVRTRRTLVNSEGTVSVRPSTMIRLEFKCRTQADDGMNLVNFDSWVVSSLSDLPPADELVRRARAVADELVAMRSAPVIEDYTGPILFEGEAAAMVLNQLLVPNLSGTPPPNDPRYPSYASDDTAFANKHGKKVLPTTFTVVDDPSLPRWKDTPLIGGYAVDDEGVPAAKVTVVRGGMLEAFLMSRTPRKKFLQSNGHGRSGFGGGTRAQISNLVVTAAAGLSGRALEDRLIQRARGEGETFGIVVTRMDDFGVTGGYREPGEAMQTGAEGGTNVTPVIAYKVSRSGERQLLRGVDIENLRVRSLKEVIATSKAVRAYNVFANGLATSIVSPDLLFEEADVKERTGNNPKLPILTTPLAKP